MTTIPSPVSGTQKGKAQFGLLFYSSALFLVSSVHAVTAIVSFRGGGAVGNEHSPEFYSGRSGKLTIQVDVCKFHDTKEQWQPGYN